MWWIEPSSVQPTAQGSLGPGRGDLEDPLLGTALPQDGQFRGPRGRRQKALPQGLPCLSLSTEPEGGVAQAPPPVVSVLAEPRGGSWTSRILGQKPQSPGESVSASRGQHGWSPAGRREPHYPAGDSTAGTPTALSSRPPGEAAACRTRSDGMARSPEASKFKPERIKKMSQ